MAHGIKSSFDDWKADLNSKLAGIPVLQFFTPISRKTTNLTGRGHIRVQNYHVSDLVFSLRVFTSQFDHFIFN